MNMHLAEIATKVASGAQAALLVDQAGWHMSARLVVPPNITIVPLPPKCPELLISQLFRLLSLEFFCDSFHDAA